MTTIHPIPALNDNYIWCISHQGEAIIIDPSSAEPVEGYLKQHQLKLKAIWITHHHNDHTAGIPALRQTRADLPIYGNHDIQYATHIYGKDPLPPIWLDHDVRVIDTPGHTATHISYLYTTPDKQEHIFCGDTLFSAGCGRIFTGTATELHHSLQLLTQRPNNPLYYPAHEYTAANLRFAQHIEPNNPQIEQALQATKEIPTLPTSQQHEQQINPFLRAHLPHIQARVAKLSGTPPQNTLHAFTLMRELKNHF